MDDTGRSMRNVVAVMEPLRADIASLKVMLPVLKQARPLQADVTASKSLQSLVKMNRQVKPSNSKRVAPSVTGFYPSPFGMLFYYKVDLQGGENEILDAETENQVTVKQRTFRLSPSKWSRVLGGQEVEVRIAIYPDFDRFSVNCSTNQRFDFGLGKALGFYREASVWEWKFNKVDFSLLRRLLSEGKISANNRFCDQNRSLNKEDNLLVVSTSDIRLTCYSNSLKSLSYKRAQASHTGM